MILPPPISTPFPNPALRRAQHHVAAKAADRDIVVAAAVDGVRRARDSQIGLHRAHRQTSGVASLEPVVHPLVPQHYETAGITLDEVVQHGPSGPVVASVAGS